jgi:hypothetical protein
MQSTGVYWMPVLEVLEESGLEVCRFHASHAVELGHALMAATASVHHLHFVDAKPRALSDERPWNS